MESKCSHTADGINNEHRFVAFFQGLFNRKGEADFGIERTKDQPTLTSGFDRFVRGFVLPSVDRATIDDGDVRQFIGDRGAGRIKRHLHISKHRGIES